MTLSKATSVRLLSYRSISTTSVFGQRQSGPPCCRHRSDQCRRANHCLRPARRHRRTAGWRRVRAITRRAGRTTPTWWLAASLRPSTSRSSSTVKRCPASQRRHCSGVAGRAGSGARRADEARRHCDVRSQALALVGHAFVQSGYGAGRARRDGTRDAPPIVLPQHGAAQIRLLGELRRAIDHAELDLVYQPENTSAFWPGRRAGGLMVLAASAGALRPDGFMALVRQHDRCDKDRIRADQASTMRCALGDVGVGAAVAVNVFAPDLKDAALPDALCGALRSRDLSPALLTVEITEDLILNDIDWSDGCVAPVARTRHPRCDRRPLRGFSAPSHLRDPPIDAGQAGPPVLLVDHGRHVPPRRCSRDRPHPRAGRHRGRRGTRTPPPPTAGCASTAATSGRATTSAHPLPPSMIPQLIGA